MSYYKTRIVVTVLSDGPYNPDTIHDLAYDITEGECSGDYKVESSEELTREEMAEALEAQGSDPAFLLGEE